MSEHSRKDYTNRGAGLRAALASLKPGDVVTGTCFSQAVPDTRIFPDDMTGVTFALCNLDNVYVPPGNTVTDCTTQRWMAQNDGNDWIVDENNEPIEIVGSTTLFDKHGLTAPKPEDIPQEKVADPVDWQMVKRIEKAQAEQAAK